jgi:membrane associated rhomboid family serine protease
MRDQMAYNIGDTSIISELLALLANVKNNAVDVLQVIGVLWIIQVANFILGNKLCILGVVPRKIYGLLGIICSPFIHYGFNHVFFNSIPLFVLLSSILAFGIPAAICTTVMIIAISGLGVWLFGRSAIHVGASGLIMGYMGYILYSAYYTNSVSSIVVGVLCFYYLGSILFSVIPTDETSSWEGHLFGLLAGVFTAHFGCIAPFDYMTAYIMAIFNFSL